MKINEELWDAIYYGNAAEVVKVVEAEIAAGVDAVEMVNTTMIPALREIGEAFSVGEVFIPEMLVGARAMQAGMDVLEPLLVKGGSEPVAKVCIGSVKGDLHDIGKNLVVIMLKGSGFEVDDIGVNCTIADYEAAVERGSKVVCLSSLLSTTRDEMKPVIEHFSDRDHVKVVVGGAAVTAEFAQQIGADEFGVDAGDAVRAVRSSLGLAA
ncbi:MAG: cobalamin-dependent protein [Xanthomonadales bacterium]|jgi:5-methyltetrahydrofolate--homocysteine methyltransferase|nr:cobalamin-dependent protein [Xanthomonadales bacterium]